MIRIDIIASGSKGNCNVLWDGEIGYLLDIGVPLDYVRQYYFERNELHIFNNIRYAIISHKHGDHSKAFKQWGERIGYEYILRDYENETPVPIKIGNFLFTPFYIAHDVTNYGYDIYNKTHDFRICWFTDAADVPNIEMKNKFDVFLVEANHTNSQYELAAENDYGRAYNYRRHMSIEKITSWLLDQDLSSTEVIHFLHITTDRQIDNNVWAEKNSTHNVSNYVIAHAKLEIDNRIIINAIEPFLYTNTIKSNMNKGATYVWNTKTN